MTASNSSSTQHPNTPDQSAIILLIIRYWKVVVPILVALCSFEWYVFDFTYDLNYKYEKYEKQIKIDNLNKEIIDLKKELEEKEKTIYFLKQNIYQKDIKIENLNHEILERRDKIHELENQLNYYRIRVKS